MHDGVILFVSFPGYPRANRRPRRSWQGRCKGVYMLTNIAVYIRSDSSVGTEIQVTLYFSQQGEAGKPGADGKDGAAVRIL